MLNEEIPHFDFGGSPAFVQMQKLLMEALERLDRIERGITPLPPSSPFRSLADDSWDTSVVNRSNMSYEAEGPPVEHDQEFLNALGQQYGGKVFRKDYTNHE